jgi:hypothetical protein
MTNEQQTNQWGRVAIVHYRDRFELSNRTLAEAFQVSPDRLENFLSGDDDALTQSQKTYIGLELAHLADGEDVDREEMKQWGLKPDPGVREVLGITK